MATEITDDYSAMLQHAIKRAHDQKSSHERVLLKILTGIYILEA